MRGSLDPNRILTPSQPCPQKKISLPECPSAMKKQHTQGGVFDQAAMNEELHTHHKDLTWKLIEDWGFETQKEFYLLPSARFEGNNANIPAAVRGWSCECSWVWVCVCGGVRTCVGHGRLGSALTALPRPSSPQSPRSQLGRYGKEGIRGGKDGSTGESRAQEFLVWLALENKIFLNDMPMHINVEHLLIEHVYLTLVRALGKAEADKCMAQASEMEGCIARSVWEGSERAWDGSVARGAGWGRKGGGG